MNLTFEGCNVNIKYMFYGFWTGCLVIMMMTSISISSHLDMIAWHLNRVSLKMTKREGFCGKPIEQHPSSIVSGVGADYYKASLNMLNLVVEEMEDD